MAVDKNGFICQPEFMEVQPAFSQLITDSVKGFTGVVPGLIHSIYLYGSVAEGRATENDSDLDLTVIFTQELDDETARKMAEVKSSLEKAHPVVSKIDIDPGTLDTVLRTANKNLWGYWLKHHCVCVYGEDLRERFEPFRPSKDIAVAVNGDFLAVLNSYVSRMKPSLEPAERHALQRAAARKAIRATNILREEGEQEWPASLEEHCERFNARYPALAEEMDYWLAISYRPRGDIVAFAGRIKTFAYWLNAEFHTRQR